MKTTGNEAVVVNDHAVLVAHYGTPHIPPTDVAFRRMTARNRSNLAHNWCRLFGFLIDSPASITDSPRRGVVLVVPKVLGGPELYRVAAGWWQDALSARDMVRHHGGFGVAAGTVPRTLVLGGVFVPDLVAFIKRADRLPENTR